MKKEIFVLAGMLMVSTSVWAVLNLEADTVWFNDVGQDAGNYFGAPGVVGDSILFNPTNFAAGTGEAQSFLNKQLWFTIDAKAGRDIDSLEIEEYGDWSLFGIGDDATNYVSVSAVGHVRIEQVEFQDLANPIEASGTMLLKKTSTEYWDDNIFGLTSDGPGVEGWEGELYFDIDQILLDNGIANGKATRIYFTMDNVLFATSEAGNVAQIEKKDVGGFVLTVPEPTTMVLLGLGGLLLRRRK